MAKKIADHRKNIVRALKGAGLYRKGLEAQITALAGALRALDLTNDEIDELETATIHTVSRYGNATLAPHPVFKIQRDAQASVTRLTKALGLTVDDLAGGDDSDPLAELTRKVLRTGAGDGTVTVKPEEP